VSSSRFNINLVEELTLGNFKCFSTTQSLPLRPITLLYGPNGAGKSSVIQALNWLPDLATGSWRQKFARFVRNYDQGSDLTFGGTISVAEETDPEPALAGEHQKRYSAPSDACRLPACSISAVRTADAIKTKKRRA
jgi:energy-coupling factor transporter ATP-binding protein EcfA2